MAHSQSLEIQVDEEVVTEDCTSNDDNVITVLSIDGGGIRGIIPAVILEALEKKLQEINQDNSLRIVDFFDVIAGTSTGSIIAALLTLPDEGEKDSPLYTASQIKDFYRKYGPMIFSKKAKKAAKKEAQQTAAGQKDKKENAQKEEAKSKETKCSRMKKSSIVPCGTKQKGAAQPTKKYKCCDYKSQRKKAGRLIARLLSRYDPSYLRVAVSSQLDNIGLDETLKDVVVPAFNLKTLRPFIFTTSEAKELRKLMYGKIKFSDVIISSTAAPTYFLHHSLQYKGKKNRFMDGGLVANNPALIALCEAMKLHGNKADYSNYLVLSLGTGRPRQFPMPICNPRKPHWLLNLIPCLRATEGSAEWFCPSCFGGNSMPRFLEYTLNSKSDMVEIYMSLIFQDRDNYLRIQDYELKDEAAPMDDASPFNLHFLQTIGKELLGKPLSVINPDTGLPEEKEISNEAALNEFAKKLSEARKKKQAMKEKHVN